VTLLAADGTAVGIDRRLAVMPRIKKHFAVLAAGTLVSAALGSGVAIAASGHHPATTRPAHFAVKTADETNTGPDTDNVQQGDQTSPDRVGDGSRSGAESGNATESENSTESENGPSDGPGGHADPAGNVDHQFNGEE
jgi:hypothetical protein